VYSAEQTIELGAPLASVHDARALVRRARRSAWWRTNIGPLPSIQVVVDGRSRGEWAESWSSPNRRYGPDRWVIHVHPDMLNEIVVLHELTHCIAPQWAGYPRRIRRGHLDWAQLHWHGPEFTGLFAELLRRYGTGDNHLELAAAYRHFEVPVAGIDEVLAARAHSATVALAIADTLAETEHRAEQAERAADATRTAESDQPTAGDPVGAGHEGGAAAGPARPARCGGVVPSFEWGWWLTSSRRRPGRTMTAGRRQRLVGRDRLAALISPVEPCTARDIAALEEAPELPDDVRLRRIAMTAVAVLEIDPVWARTVLGLVRWDCNVELDELRGVAPDWVAHVEHLNELGSTLPERWSVPGQR
jgi:hypothetical protein